MSIRDLALNVARVAHKKAGTTVNSIDPDGKIVEHDDCQFLSGRTTESPDSGANVVVFRPVATFPRNSFPNRIPKDGENWVFQCPLDPDQPSALTSISMDESKAIEGGRSLGVIRIYLSTVKQS